MRTARTTYCSRSPRRTRRQTRFRSRTLQEQASASAPDLKRANRLGLLTIGSDAEFIAAAGMVSLVVEGRKIVVEVNGDAIKDANWVFSSHLLEVSRVTRPGSTE